MIPATYPIIRVIRKITLFPLVDLDLQELSMEKGHAAPKQSSMIISKMLNDVPPAYFFDMTNPSSGDISSPSVTFGG